MRFVVPWHVHLPVEARAAFVPKVSHPIARHRTAQFSNIVAQAPPVLCHICPNGRLTGVRRVRNTTEINENMLQNWQKRLQNIHGTDLLTKSKAFKNPKFHQNVYHFDKCFSSLDVKSAPAQVWNFGAWILPIRSPKVSHPLHAKAVDLDCHEKMVEMFKKKG